MTSPASNSSVDICNAALLLVGAEELNSLADETREAKVCNTLYPFERDALLVCHPWKFTLAYRQLSRLDEIPVHTAWQYVYAVPSDSIEVLSDLDRNEYRLGEGNRLYSNTDPVKLLYQIQADETRFSAPFRLALMTKLASALALSLNEDNSKSKELLERHRLELRKARFLDSKQAPPVGLPESAYRIVADRMTGSGVLV